MKHPEIKILYKYVAYNTYSLSILINRKVWFAKPDSFNDPFDCTIPFDFSRYTPEKVVEYCRKKGLLDKKIDMIEKLCDDDFNLFLETLKEISIMEDKNKLQNSGVFSLSEENDNILMWGHYADRHRGFCIGFERNADNCLGDDERTCRVEYKPDYPIIDLADNEVFDLKFFRKASDWEYEREWRIISMQGNMEKELPGVQISTIVFGLNMPDDHRKTIRKITADIPGIKYQQAVMLPGAYALGIEDL